MTICLCPYDPNLCILKTALQNRGRNLITCFYHSHNYPLIACFALISNHIAGSNTDNNHTRHNNIHILDAHHFPNTFYLVGSVLVEYLLHQLFVFSTYLFSLTIKKAHPEGCAEKVLPSVSLPHYTDKYPQGNKERTPFTKVLSPLRI